MLFRVNDHYTRVKVQGTTVKKGDDTPMADAHDGSESMKPFRSVGCLLGEQHGRVVRISTCFDMPLVQDGSSDECFSSIDWDLLKRKVELYREMDQSVDVVGWYLTAMDLCTEDVWLHQKFVGLNPAAVLLVFNPCDQDTSHALRVYETEEHVVDGQKRVRFTKATHEIVSSEMERIVVNQFTDLSVSEEINGISTALKTHQTDLHSAVLTMIDRVSQLQRILISMRDGTMPYDAEVIMAISAFVNRLPLSQGTDMVPDDCSSQNVVEKQKDALLTTLIAATMAGLSSLEEHTELDAMSSHHASTAVAVGGGTPQTLQRP